MNQSEKANRLVNSTSPYLLQHAYNPVDWYPWSQEALEKAAREDKIILVSIGYSSCHWCHVMERESFENESVASLMNKDFINIKVDREERPDIDQIYMDAVQMMGVNGGWPLNIFLTPDQKPFYGGTYFPSDRWVKLLESISSSFSSQREEISKAAEDIAANLNRSELEKFRLQFDQNPFDLDTLDDAVKKLATTFDDKNGGFKRSPKFPLPSDWLFLLQYSRAKEDPGIQAHCLFTLEKMAQGGIYDQMGGGFARYSTDEEWFAPHFEKMLYDNGQLLALYAEAFKISGTESFKKVVYQTVAWLEREMMSEEGGFYSAMDADSEGVEGKFYTWKAEHLKELLGEDYSWYSEFYGIKETGNWEDGSNILFKTQDEDIFAESRNLKPSEFSLKLAEWNRTLLQIRNNRVAPGLDDKVLTGWNAMTITGLVSAYQAFKEPKFLDLALQNGHFLIREMMEENSLFRSHKNGKSHISGYLEDYAFTIQAFQALYEATWDEEWIYRAADLADFTITHFFDETEKLFFYTSSSSEELIARKKEIFDNVIPSSNSQMAINLHKLGIIMDKPLFSKISDDMLRQVTQLAKQEPTYMSNWASLYVMKSNPTAEIVIVGDDYINVAREFKKLYQPNGVVMATKESSDLPLFKSRVSREGKTTIYVCYDKACKLPVTTIAEAIDQLN